MDISEIQSYQDKMAQLSSNTQSCSEKADSVEKTELYILQEYK